MTDNPKITRRRAREMKTISQMICMYCAGNHANHARSRTAYCGEPVCEQCLQIDSYALEHTRTCKNMETKISCEQCANHCYAPQEREDIRRIMRYAGPRMLTKHPIAAIRHMLGK